MSTSQHCGTSYQHRLSANLYVLQNHLLLTTEWPSIIQRRYVNAHVQLHRDLRVPQPVVTAEKARPEHPPSSKAHSRVTCSTDRPLPKVTGAMHIPAPEEILRWSPRRTLPLQWLPKWCVSFLNTGKGAGTHRRLTAVAAGTAGLSRITLSTWWWFVAHASRTPATRLRSRFTGKRVPSALLFGKGPSILLPKIRERVQKAGGGSINPVGGSKFC